ncbi:hypothetical protein [Flavobacterium sp.]|uniref:hypothetical protein n=1 Tax=Flavobacterium sp. TaxID=239 RepID=UPI0037A7AE21
MNNFSVLKIKVIFLVLTIFLLSNGINAQYYKKHYIAPANWNYFTNANEIVVCTNSAITATITVSKSDGTFLTTLTATQGTPAVYRFLAIPNTLPVWSQSTVLNAAGLIITADQLISVNIRNVMSDNYTNGNWDAYIKGNASLFSFGDAGIGINFRVGYYRNTPAADLGYSIMAIEDGTVVSANGTLLTTLNAGQSYIIPSLTYGIGTLVTASKGSVMTVYKHTDTPGGCGDGTYDQIPPVSVLGNDYIIYRSTGTPTPEQNTVVATVANTVVTNSTFNATTGALIATTTTTLVNAGDYITYPNGDGSTAFSANRVTATQNVVVYAGQAQSCEVDISTVTPINSSCSGSKLQETYKFRNYTLSDLPYFGYVLLKDPSAVVLINGVNMETVAGLRRQLGTTGWYLIDFTNAQISSPTDILITSTVSLTVSLVQQGGGFSMSSIFSSFIIQPNSPSITYSALGACPANSQGTLKAVTGYSNYQWYFNDVAISGAKSSTYIAKNTGIYTYSALLPCGDSVASVAYTVTTVPCVDLKITKTIDNFTPTIGNNATFTITATNNGPSDDTGVNVTDMLPTGYTLVKATPSSGSWSSPIWTIGNLASGASATLTVVATVNAVGIYTNTATVTGDIPDADPSNNSASVTPTCIDPPAPILGTITQPTCKTALASIALSGLPSTGSWTVLISPTVAGATGTIGTGTTTTIGALPAGSYTFMVTNSFSCTSSPTTSTTINAQPATPATPILAATIITNPCPVTTANLLAAHLETTPTNTTLVWYTTPNPTGSSIAYATPTTATAGTYYAFYLNNVNGCLSSASASLTVTITACCAAGYVSPILR